ncbi:hypothetical protein F441_20270 [Phytophthora nicotianae CJ01A1]|uniref:Uncharacterized protein n=2 Tax=Phytophthora nicotianae CJ01A1 TaxID=1317063 RepID=W2VY54_PHYNI|nr:hypothetical protein F441_20270 [Phytophthora nicotianae CJ01A1]
MTSRSLPEVTPCVLFKRIVPQLRKKGWQITRGRGLEEGDRIYRPNCKTKGKLAKRDEDYFLCYDGHKANRALVDYVFVNGILTPEEIWMPHELSSEDESSDVLKYLKESLSQEANEAMIHHCTDPQPKKKRNVERVNTGGKKKATHTAEKRPVKRQKKSSKQQCSAHLLPQQPLGIEAEGAIGADARPADTERARVAGEFGVDLLLDAKLRMLDFVTMVNRRWRALKDLEVLEPLNGNLTTKTQIEEAQASVMESIKTVMADIRASQLDLNCEVADVVEWVKANSSHSVAVDIRAAYPTHLELGLSERFEVLCLRELVDEIKRYMQEFVIAVRRSRRALCGKSTTFRTQVVATPTERTTRCEDFTRSIADLLNDLSEGMNETVTLFEIRAACAEATVYDSEKTDTDDES